MKHSKIAGLLIIALILLTGCGKQSELAGRWSTTEPFGDIPLKVTAEITLSHEDNVVSGTVVFTPLNDVTGQQQGSHTFPLEQIQFDGKQLSFIVPIFPERPKECMLFNLQLDGDNLKGTGKVNDTNNKNLTSLNFRKSPAEQVSGENGRKLK